MADLIKKIKIKRQDGTYTNYIPIGVDAINAITDDGDSVQFKLNKKPYCFDTVADMKNAKLKKGDYVVTLGYYEINDGGSSIYKIRTQTENDIIDNGAIISIKDTLVAEIITNEIYVEQFGARGDGQTDDSAAFQNALNYASNRCILKLHKNKVYLIANTLKTYKNTNFNLNGSTIKVNKKISLFWNFNPTDTYLLYNGNGNIEIYNGIIDGGVISYIHGENIRFENIIFNSCLWDHFIEICACKDFKIINCEFNGIITQTSDRNYVECIQIDVCKRIAFPYFTDENNPTYDDTLNKNIYINNCKFTRGNSGFSLYTAIGSHSWSANLSNYNDNVKILNCYIENPEHDAIRLYSCSNSNVENCIIKNVGKKGIIIDGNSNNIVVNNNQIYNCTETNIGIYNNEDAYSKENIFITNNVFKSTGSLIAASTISNLQIKDNSFNIENLHSQVIWLNNIINTVFKGNIFNKTALDKNIIFVNSNTTFDYCDEYLRLYYGNITGSINLNLNITLFNDLVIALGAPSLGTYTTKNIKSWVLENFRLNDKFQFNNGETKQLFTIDSANAKNIVSSVSSGTELPIRGIYARKI